VWRSRAVSGPYKSSSDVAKYSPGDWARIVGLKDKFLGDSDKARWNPSFSGCLSSGQTYNPDHKSAAYIRDAGFYALVKDDTTVANKVIDELLAQVRTRNADFSDTSRFCRDDSPSGYGRGARPFGTHPWFVIGEWGTELLFAFDYVKAYATQAEQAEIREWFKDSADYMHPNMKARYDNYFVNRWADDYRLVKSSHGRLTDERPFYGGPRIPDLALQYNNRDSSILMYTTLVGADQNIDYLKDHGERWVKDYLVATYFPKDEWVGEHNRHGSNSYTTADTPDYGWAYGHALLGHLITMADVLARTGDTDAYDFTSTNGVDYDGGVTSKGAPAGFPEGKSLRSLIHTWTRYSDHTIKRYGTLDSGKLTDPYLIDGSFSVKNWNSVRDIVYAQANMYYRDDHIKGAYLRTNPGMKPYSSSVESGSAAWMGGGKVYPGVLFQFGQMEHINPYPTK